MAGRVVESKLDPERSVTEVSVIIPTRNRCRMLELALRSVTSQRGVDYEAIIVDEASTDGTPDILRMAGADRVRVVRHDVPMGVSAARNRGIAEARGEWVAFLDDDDLWAPDKLERQLEAARRTGRHWAYAGAVDVNVNHRVFAGQPPAPPERVMAELTQRNMLPAGSSNVMVRRSWLPPIAFDGSFFHSADWDLWIRLSRQGPPACVPKPLVGYRFHPGSASLDLDGMFAEADEIERRHGGVVDRGDFNRYLARFARRSGWRRKALRYYWRAAMTGDRRYVTKEFLPDVWSVFAEYLRSRAGRFGVTSGPHSARDDPNRAWKEEAQHWVDTLVSPAAGDSGQSNQPATRRT
jgi:glycosyltransferase involved in cell wall biosynthesis